jgi:hypothetical protein
MTVPKKGASNADKIAKFFKGVVREVANGADLVMDPVGHYERGKEEKRLRLNRDKLAAVMERQQGNAQVHILQGQGPLGTDTVVEDRGSEFRAEAAQKGDDGTAFWDVAGKPLALINTRSNIESFLAGHAQTRLVNTEVFAELGHEIHYLSDVDAGVNIGVAVSVFRPLSEKDRYKVINPVVAAVTLLGPQLAGLGAGAIGAVAEAPSALAGAARDAHGMVETVLGEGKDAKNMVSPGESKPLDIGEPIFIISFSTTGFAPADDSVRTERASFPCQKLGKYFGVRVGDISGHLLGLISSLAG